jgi:hypothetical protein
MVPHSFRLVVWIRTFGFAALSATIASAQERPIDPVGFPLDCASSLRDRSNPAQCLVASSVPQVGALYPLSQNFFVSPATGNVGINTFTPAVPLTVHGTIGVGNDQGAPRAAIRPSVNGSFGVLETFGGFFNRRTLLLSTVSTAPTSGAIATQEESGRFLALITTPVSDPLSGYVSVLSGNVETAGMNGETGVVFGAAKSFVQPHPEDATKEIQYVSLEGPEHGVYFRGTERLRSGEAVLEVPESFRLVARENGLTVSLSPLGPSRGLYVAEKGLERIVVRENPEGSGDVSFDFLVMGTRSAMPEHVAVRDNVHFAPAPGTTIEAGRMPGHYRELLVKNGTLGADGSVNESLALRLGWKQANGAWSEGPSASARPAEK